MLDSGVSRFGTNYWFWTISKGKEVHNIMKGVVEKELWKIKERTQLWSWPRNLCFHV